jgi:predicted transcriptional regulator
MSKEKDGSEGEALRDAWRRGRRAHMERTRAPNSSVLSVRVPDALLRQLTVIASEQDKPVGTLARELIEDAVLAKAARTPQSLARQFARWANEIDWTEPEIDLAITYTSRVLINNSWLRTTGSTSDAPWGVPASALAYGGRFRPSLSESHQTKSSQRADQEHVA